MSFYIAFNNISAFLEMSEFVNLTEDVEATVVDSIEDVGQPDAARLQTNALTEVDDSSENPIFAIDYGEITAVPAPQISPADRFNNEMLDVAAQVQNPKIEAENADQNDDYEEFHSLLKKFEISLHYRYGFTDVFASNLETKNSQNFGKLTEKNLGKQLIARQEDFEKRFQEKQAENFNRHLKEKRFATQLQNKNK